jgi:SAM-dependent methyltransferase
MSLATHERAHFDRHWEQMPPLNQAEEDRLAAVCSLVPQDVRTLLDIGAGNGWFVRTLARTRTDISATALDFSAAAMTRFPGAAAVGSSDALPFVPGAFDLITSCDCLEHLPDGVFEKTLEEIRRLRPRYVIINTPINELKNGWDRSTCYCPGCRTRFHRDHHVRHFSEAEYRNLLGDDYELTRDAYGGWHIRFLVHLPHAVAGWLQWGMRDGLLCPRCGNESFPDSRWKARLRWGISMFDYAVTRPFRSVLTRRSEYAALYRLRSI